MTYLVKVSGCRGGFVKNDMTCRLRLIYRQAGAYGLGMTNRTTPDAITDEQIRNLREEAIKAGDREQIAVCVRALNGSEADRAECARVIAEARARAGARTPREGISAFLADAHARHIRAALPVEEKVMAAKIEAEGGGLSA